MPEDLKAHLFTQFPDFPNASVFIDNLKTTEFISFDQMLQTVYAYLRTIPNICSVGDFSDDAKLFSLCLKEIEQSFNKYVKLLTSDIETLRSKYVRHISKEFNRLIDERPHHFSSNLLYDVNERRIFGSHSIPSKINPA